MKKLLTLLLPLISFAAASAQPQDNIKYTTPNFIKIWNDALGNHRAIIEVSQPSQAIELDFLWRRHDKDPQNRRFILINAQDGSQIKNILRKEVNNERCNIVFGPVNTATEYYLYYLPYPIHTGWGGFGADYLKSEDAPDGEWVAKIGKDLPKAKVQTIQARTEFDSFYPMEVTALASETADYKSKNSDKMLLFPEDRAFPIRMRDAIPQKWLSTKQGAAFAGRAERNEYYAYQIGVWAAGGALDNLKVEWSDLKSGNNTILKKDITCFNTEGYNPRGEYFTKNISVKEGIIQPLWFGVDIAESATAGTYRGTVSISAEGVAPKSVDVAIEISDKVTADRGDSELWRHSRLRWLNSRAGIGNEPTKGYTNVEVDGNKLSVKGRQVVLGDDGLPHSIKAKDNEILAGGIEFIIQTDKGNTVLRTGKPEYTLQDNGRVEWTTTGANDEMKLNCRAALEFDGWVNYIYTITPLKNIKVKDIRLNIPMRGEVAHYMMGMGLEGGNVPSAHSSKWFGAKQSDKPIISTTSDAPVKLDGLQDSFWVGNSDAGLSVELRGASYTGPLLNLYRPAPPVSWNNGGKGGFVIKKEGGKVLASVYSGERELKPNETIVFDFAFIITPVKSIDYKSQFNDRYYHNGSNPTPAEEDIAAGVKVINVHHANELNPYINYPFLTTAQIKNFTDYWHSKDVKVKLYYTIRELTNNVPEIWALRSLGNEILGSGRGGGYPWLREHLVDDYLPQWYQYLGPVNSADASIVNSPGESRWYNYYIEGLGWLVKNLGINGIYLDDVTYGRDMLKRMRRVMDANGDCAIDLHSNTGFSRGAVIQYTEFFPYVDKLWFGESFYYNRMSPENWLVEVSGIPFGLMGDMLHRGGNRWRGMVYGMTVRHPWMTDGILCDPRPVWKVWDNFGIADSKMVGYWRADAPVRTSNDKILATTYINPNGEILVAVGSWAEKPTDFTLKIDWKALGINPATARIVQPEIVDFQSSAEYKATDKIRIEPTKGYLIYIR